MNIPRDKTHPPDAVQCAGCGGHGCKDCWHSGWKPAGSSGGRLCFNDDCTNSIPPDQVAVYCSPSCACGDA